MPFDGYDRRDCNLLLADTMLRRQSEEDQGAWATCLWGALREARAVPTSNDTKTRHADIAKALGVTEAVGWSLCASAHIDYKRRLVEQAMGKRGLRRGEPPPRRVLRKSLALLAVLLIGSLSTLIL